MTTDVFRPLPASLSTDEVRSTYGWQARFYDAWASFTETRARQVALSRAALTDGTDVLEVAVGTGLMFEQVLQQNPRGHNVGIDLTEPMLRRARRRAARTGLAHQLEIGDARRLPLGDDSVDVLLNSYMFDLLAEEDFSVVLGEFARVLRPGGRVVITNLAAAPGLFMALWHGMYRLKPSLVGGCRGVLLEGPLVEAGFSIQTRDVVRQFGFPSEVLTATWPGAEVRDV